MEVLQNNARTILIFQELQNLERKNALYLKVNAMQKSKACLNMGNGYLGTQY